MHTQSAARLIRSPLLPGNVYGCQKDVCEMPTRLSAD